MPPSDTSGGTLVDDLIDVVDDVHEIADDLGARPFRVYVVRRAWSGRRGDSAFVDTFLELVPRPEVVDLALRAELRGAGLEQEGDHLLRCVSLKYSSRDLFAEPGDVGPSDEMFYKLVDTRGQNRPDRFFVAARPPWARRGDGRSDEIDWNISLRRRSDPEAG